MAIYEAECPVAAAAATPEQRVKQAKVSRRQWLRSASRFAAALPLSLAGVSRLPAFDLGKIRQLSTSSAVPPPATATQALATLFGGVDPTKYRFTREEDAFLEGLERACFQFFWDQVNPFAGLVKDRSHAGGPDSRNVASIAATGFGLTALCIADHRG